MANPWEFLPFDAGQSAGLDPRAAQYQPGDRGQMAPADAFRAELLAGGLPAHVVDGIMLNGHDESGFDPTAVGDNGNAFGILQWNGPRKRALEGFAAERGANPGDPRVQAQFTLYELQGPEKKAFNYLMATTTAGEAGAAFVNHFERPAEEHRARREAAYLGGKVPTGGWAQPSGQYTGSNALAAPSVPGMPATPQNALAAPPQPPAMQSTQIDPAMFMRQPGNALAMMQPLTYQRRSALG